MHSGWEHLEALHRARRPARACPTSSSTRSPTAATRCPRPARGYLARARALAAPRRADRHGQRPLLRDGPRPPLGPHRSSPTTRSSTARALPRADRRRGGRATPTSAARPTSSSSRRVIGDDDGIRRRRRVLFFNFRPDRARAAHARAGRARLRRVRPRPARHGRPDHADRVPGGLALPGRVSAEARPATTLAEVARRARRRASSTSPRPRSTPTSPTSSTAAARQEWEGEERRLVDSPRDVPTYDHKPEMSAARGRRRRSRGAGASDGYRFGIINFANPDMVGHTGVIPAAVQGVETVDGCLGEVVAAVHARVAPASSPPTTATRTTCSSPTARPTPPTRLTRCR